MHAVSPRISVIIATYHGEHFLAEQLRSIFKQSRPPNEILIGDDSDNSATAAVVESLRREFDGDLRYIHNEPRLRVVRNFLNLALQSTGDYIFFSDQDDYWLPEKIERLMSLLEAAPPHKQLVACNSLVVNEKLESSSTTVCDFFPKTLVEQIATDASFDKVRHPRFTIWGHNICIKRSFLKYFAQMPANFPVHDIWLCQTASMLNAMLFTTEVLTLYRVHNNNISTITPEVHQEGVQESISRVAHQNSDLPCTAMMVNALNDFAQRNPDVPENNRKLASRLARYFNARMRCRRFCRPLRFLGWTPSLLVDYFRVGTGYRALLRDLIFSALCCIIV